jgi:hypothetical protein
LGEGKGEGEVPIDNRVEETGAFFHVIALHHFPPIREVALGYRILTDLPVAFTVNYTVKKNFQIFYQTFQKWENPYADKGFFGALQRRKFLSFEEGKVFLFLPG